MSKADRGRKPVLPNMLFIAGIVVGFIGLLMLILGIGGTAPTTLPFPGTTGGISTTSLAFAVIGLGFGVALATLLMAATYAGRQAREDRKLAENLAKLGVSAEDIAKLVKDLESTRVPDFWLWRLKP
jgi:hypothetical protein